MHGPIIRILPITFNSTTVNKITLQFYVFSHVSTNHENFKTIGENLKFLKFILSGLKENSNE